MSEEGLVLLFRAIQNGVLSVSVTDKSDAGVIGKWRLGSDEWQAWLSAHNRIIGTRERHSFEVATHLKLPD